MLSSKLLAKCGRPCARSLLQRNLHVTAPAAKKQTDPPKVAASQGVADPIQQLFIEKIREYNQRKAAAAKAGQPLVDATPDVMKKYNEEIDRINKTYNLTPETALQSPTFDFKDPKFELELYETDSFYSKVDDRNNPYWNIDLKFDEFNPGPGPQLDEMYKKDLEEDPFDKSYVSKLSG